MKKPLALSAQTTPLFVSSYLQDATETWLHVSEKSGLNFKEFVTESLDRETGDSLLALCSNPESGFLKTGEGLDYEAKLLPSRDNQCRLSLRVKPQENAPLVVRARFLDAAFRAMNAGWPTRDALKGCGFVLRNESCSVNNSNIIFDVPDDFDALYAASSLEGETLVPRFLQPSPDGAQVRGVTVSVSRGFAPLSHRVYDVSIPYDAFKQFEAVKAKRESASLTTQYPVSDMYHLAGDILHRDFGIPLSGGGHDRFLMHRDVLKINRAALFPEEAPDSPYLHEARFNAALSAAIQKKHPSLSQKECDDVRNILMLENYVAHYAKMYDTVEASDVFNRIVAITGMERLTETARTITAADCKQALSQDRVTHKEHTANSKGEHKGHDI